MFDVIVELVFLLLERTIILSQLFSVSKLSLLSFLLSSSSWLNEQRRWWQAERLLNRTFDFVIGRLRCCCVDFAGFWFTSSSQLDDTELFKSCPVRFIVQLDFKGSAVLCVWEEDDDSDIVFRTLDNWFTLHDTINCGDPHLIKNSMNHTRHRSIFHFFFYLCYYLLFGFFFLYSFGVLPLFGIVFLTHSPNSLYFTLLRPPLETFQYHPDSMDINTTMRLLTSASLTTAHNRFHHSMLGFCVESVSIAATATAEILFVSFDEWWFWWWRRFSIWKWTK